MLIERLVLVMWMSFFRIYIYIYIYKNDIRLLKMDLRTFHLYVLLL